MTNYFCRVTTSYEDFRSVIPRIEPYITGLIIYEHNVDALNVHIHFLMLNFSKSIDSLKGWIRKDTGRTYKATDWSFKTKYKPFKEDKERNVEENCITYMAKGTLEPSYNFGIRDDKVLEYKLSWIDYKTAKKQQRLTSYIVKETAKASKLRQNEMIDEIIKRLKESDDHTPDNILRLIRLIVMVENKTIIGRYKVRDYYDTVRSHVNPESWIVSMKNIVLDKNFI